MLDLISYEVLPPLHIRRDHTSLDWDTSESELHAPFQQISLARATSMVGMHKAKDQSGVSLPRVTLIGCNHGSVVLRVDSPWRPTMLSRRTE